MFRAASLAHPLCVAPEPLIILHKLYTMRHGFECLMRHTVPDEEQASLLRVKEGGKAGETFIALFVMPAHVCPVSSTALQRAEREIKRVSD